ncbi:MAG: Nif3-like dinuclear metal center hexameric protein [Planctomycetota bacterium]
MKTADVVRALDSIADPALAGSWDNVGLLVGDPEAAADGAILLAIDFSEAVYEEACEVSARTLVCYHPPIFSGMKRFVAHDARSRALLACARSGIAVYSPHTALDAVAGGVADWLLDATIGDAAEHNGARRAIEPQTSLDGNQTHKLVTFVPSSVLDDVRHALARAGAGVIGDYTHCTFASEGTGAFLGGDSTNPTVGKAGRLEHAPEIRLETVCPARALPAVIAALYDSHPYEEPAFDVFKREAVVRAGEGAGRVTDLEGPVSLDQIAQNLKRVLGVPTLRLSKAPGAERVSRVGVCPGSGGSLLDGAGLGEGGLFVTGEMKHHELLGARDRGISVLLAGHTHTERGYLPRYADMIRQHLPSVDVRVSAADVAPWVEV